MDNIYLNVNRWNSPVYQQCVLIVMGVLIVASVINYLLRKKNQYSMVAWASLKSWLIMAPIMFIIMGIKAPAPTIFLTLLAIYGAKVFFQIMGMFHKSAFVHICYLGIIGLGYSAYTDNLTLYNVMPMIVLGLSCLVPLFKKDYKNMIPDYLN
jgi:phosphatidate cytidylyltransferase